MVFIALKEGFKTVARKEGITFRRPNSRNIGRIAGTAFRKTTGRSSALVRKKRKRRR